MTWPESALNMLIVAGVTLVAIFQPLALVFGPAGLLAVFLHHVRCVGESS